MQQFRKREYTSPVLRIIDGDTIDVVGPDGDVGDHRPRRIRIAGLDAPEIHPRPTREGIISAAWLKWMLDGKIVRVIPTRRWSDPYGRQIARVFLGTVDITTASISAGHGKPWRTGPRRLALLASLTNHVQPAPLALVAGLCTLLLSTTGCTIAYERKHSTPLGEDSTSFKAISPFRDIQAIVGGAVEGLGKTLKP